VTFATLDSLRESLASAPGGTVRSPEYVSKMLHDVPDAEVVDRAKFILDQAHGKVVLDIGASGKLHEELVKAAPLCYGIDRQDGNGIVGIDLDDVRAELPQFPGIQLIVCGEVVEHLGNPQWFLTRLRAVYPGIPVIVSVPNAFSEIARKHMEQGRENVNVDHAAWYSWRTLTTLAGRAGYAVAEFYWYNGRPGFAEGLVFVLEGRQ
jgi:2-polyprenyl-3-methyl-5-hydroxy-6-metoxy-1,4-benzoquinol methylase